MNTVNLSLEDYEKLRDIKENLEKYKREADERKFKVKITDNYYPFNHTTYQTNDDFIKNMIEQLKHKEEKIEELEDKIESLKKPDWQCGPYFGCETKRKKFLGIF